MNEWLYTLRGFFLGIIIMTIAYLPIIRYEIKKGKKNR